MIAGAQVELRGQSLLKVLRRKICTCSAAKKEKIA
jgi:hypothetical protein